MAYYSYLSQWERFKLLGGSYTHPNGLIELDFEEPAGINPFVDDEEVQRQKLMAYETRKNIKASHHPRGDGDKQILIAGESAL